MIYEMFYESNKYLHQLYVDIKHSMRSFSTYYVKLALKDNNEIIINQGR